MANYEDQYQQTLRQRERWAQVVLHCGKSTGIMANDYVHTDVFLWLNSNVGPTFNSIRNSKWATGNNWAYTFDHKRRHVFLFADRDIAMRFKLTWV